MKTSRVTQQPIELPSLIVRGISECFLSSEKEMSLYLNSFLSTHNVELITLFSNATVVK